MINLYRWLYWVNGSTILRSKPNGTDLHILITGSKPLSITIDFLSNSLYWTEHDEGVIVESTLDGLFKRTIFSDYFYKPFQVNIVRDYVLATSRINNSYVLIRRDDLSVAFIETANDKFYYGVSVVSLSRKPSRGKTHECTFNYILYIATYVM